MRLSINMRIDGPCRRIVKRLGSHVGDVLSVEKIRAMLYWPRLINKFAALTFDTDVLYLSYLILGRCEGGWRIKTKLTTSNRHVLHVLNSLPWPADTNVVISPCEFVEKVLRLDAKILSDEIGWTDYNWSSEEIACTISHMSNRLRRGVFVSFDLVRSMLETADDCAGILGGWLSKDSTY